MGKGVVEDGAIHEACTECRRVCQTTHGKGLPYSVPRFFKRIPDYSLPSSASCNLQIPAPYFRNYISMTRREKYTLEAAPGCEWVVTLKNLAFKTGWKEFAMDYQLEKGDGIMLTLVAPNRFHVNVFDKSGMEKISTKQYMNTRASPNFKENRVADATCGGGGGAEDQCTPFESNGTDLHRAEKSNGALHRTVHGASALTSGQNGNHDNGTLFEDKHRLASNEPVRHEAEPSTTSQSSDDSEDSIQVRLAKAVLAKSREKRLKRRGKASCTSTPQAAEGTLSLGPEACKNGGKANGTSNVDPTDSSLRIHGTAVSIDEAMFEKPCGELGVSTNTCPSLITGAVVGASNVEGLIEPRAEPQSEKLQQEEEAPLPHQRPDTATGEGVRLGAESNGPAEGRPHPVFLPGLVKLEPDLSPHQNCVKCVNCGLRKNASNFDRITPPKSEPGTTECPSVDVRTPEARSASSNAPRVTEYQKQRALSAAKELSANTKNPSALVVMRVSMPADSYDCFLSVKCSEMLPSVPTELTLMDAEGNARKVNWKPNQRNMNGPGWKDLVDSHNLQINDVWVMEVIDPSELNFAVKVHILHAHDMERSPDPQPPAAPAGPVPIGSAKTPAVQTPVPVLGTQTPVVGTGAKTRSSSQLLGLVAPRSKTNKRPRTLDVNELVVKTQAPRLSEMSRPAATNAVDDDRPVTRSSPMKRLRRGSSPSTPQRGRDSMPTSGTGEEPSQAAKPAKEGKQPAVRRRHSLSTPPAKAEVVAAQRGGASQSARKLHLRSSSTMVDESAENSKQVQTRKSQTKHYKVAKMIDRRKSLQGVVFLVELADRVSPERIYKRMKAQQDEKGRWWVPHHHFSKDLSTCYIE